MDAAQRAAAERKMARRDRRAGRGTAGDAKRRSRAPKFLQSDSEGSEGEADLIGKRRRRRLYDEVQGEDDVYDEVRTVQLHCSAFL
jgi:DNA replication licensing factor MCM2